MLNWAVLAATLWAQPDKNFGAAFQKAAAFFFFPRRFPYSEEKRGDSS
jgi:hypothetical protein